MMMMMMMMMMRVGSSGGGCGGGCGGDDADARNTLWFPVLGPEPSGFKRPTKGHPRWIVDM